MNQESQLIILNSIVKMILESFHHSGISSHEVLRLIENNDETATDIYIRQDWEDYDGVDDFISSTGRAIGRNTHIRMVELFEYEDREGLSDRRWTLLLDGFKENKSIKFLSISNIWYGNLLGILKGLSSFIENNPSLDKVDECSELDFLDVDEMKTLLTPILRRHRPLKELSFSEVHMNDSDMQHFASSLRENSKMIPRTIYMDCEHCFFGPDGLRFMAEVLEDPDCSLAHLTILNRENIADQEDVTKRFAKALKHNKTLKTLDLELLWEGLSAESWNESFHTAICDKTSLEATYYSNHTLTYLGSFFPKKHPKLQDLCRDLKLNANKNKTLVARRKVFATHLYSENCVKSLGEMNPSILIYLVQFVDKVIEENNGEEKLGLGKNVAFSFLYILLKQSQLLQFC